MIIYILKLIALFILGVLGSLSWFIAYGVIADESIPVDRYKRLFVGVMFFLLGTFILLLGFLLL